MDFACSRLTRWKNDIQGRVPSASPTEARARWGDLFGPSVARWSGNSPCREFPSPFLKRDLAVMRTRGSSGTGSF
jgi:hypothetical protein